MALTVVFLFFFLREWIRKDEAIDSVPKKETVLKTISGCVNRSVREMAAIETVPKHPLAFLKLQACLRDHRDKSYKRMRPVKNGAISLKLMLLMKGKEIHGRRREVKTQIQADAHKKRERLIIDFMSTYDAWGYCQT